MIDPSEFGLLAWLENTQISLPLKGVECRFDTVGDIAHVEVDQIYHQTADRPLECTYVFPLPAEAAVHRCEFHVNGRVIRARIEEAQQARRDYEAARQAGRRAALVESSRPNLFTLSLANVQPQDLVVVRLAYVQSLEQLGEERRLRIPTCPGIRYIPGRPLLRPNRGPGVSDDTNQVPDASRISPPRISALHRDAAYLTVSGSIRIASADFDGFTTRSHSIRAEAEPDRQQISLDTESAVPDQDFLLGWTLRAARTLVPRAWTTRRGDHQYALLELRAPEGGPRVARQPMDVYFLLDSSGSMSGVKWTQACTALHELLKQLAADDRIQVTCFSNQELPLNASPISVREFQKEWPLGRLLDVFLGGGTELLSGLNGCLSRVMHFSRNRHPVMLLLTDGEVGNEQAIIDALRPFPRLVVHTFGVDTVVNDALLAGIARRQRGRCVLLRPDEDIPAALRRLGTLLAHPVRTGLGLSAGWEPADGPLADLYEGQTSTCLVRGPADSALELTGVLPDGSAAPLPLAVVPSEGAAIPLLWARRRIQDLESSGRPLDCLPLSKEFNLLCQSTAFIAWDEQEQVAVAHQTLQQPALEPALWNLGRLSAVSHGYMNSSMLDCFYLKSGLFDDGFGLAEADGDLWSEFAAELQRMPLIWESGASDLMVEMSRWVHASSRNECAARIGLLRRLLDAILRRVPDSPALQLAALAREFLALLDGDALCKANVARLCQTFGW